MEGLYHGKRGFIQRDVKSREPFEKKIHGNKQIVVGDDENYWILGNVQDVRQFS